MSRFHFHFLRSIHTNNRSYFIYCYSLLILFCFNNSLAQNDLLGKSALSEKAKAQIEKNIVNSTIWYQLNELKTLNANFPNTEYQRQINQIYETYRFTLIGTEFQQEKQTLQIQQQNIQQMNKAGLQPPPSQQQISWSYYDNQTFIRKQKEAELYQLINSSNNETATKPENQKEFNELFRIADTTSTFFKNYATYYSSAYNELLDMLSEKTPSTLKRAVFLVENAFHQNKLNYNNYCRQINDLVLSCKRFLKEKGLKADSYMANHYAIQQLFRERLDYDFNDYMGASDHTKLFVTKLLNTNRGQCHSLPILYLIIAEELNVNAYLGLAPNHSYIIFGNQNHSYNFETSNGTFVSDQWIVASGYISATAVKNGIYLSPLTKKEIIAECLSDLAMSLEYLTGKSSFSIKCVVTALKYFPNSISSLLIINNFNVARCANIAKKYHFPKESEYIKYPELKQQFDKMIEFELQMEQTGYMRIPPEQYELWQQTINDIQQRQEHLEFSDKLQENINAY